MKFQTKRWLFLVSTLVLLLAVSSALVAIAQGSYELPWSTIGSGGGHSTSGDGVYTLDATIGQAVVGVANQDPYDLCSGLWCGAAVERKIFLPLVLRNSS